MIIEETEFKGNPTLTLKFSEEDRYPFSFGLGKAKKILGAIDEIKAFVEKNDTPKPEAAAQATKAPAPESGDAPIPEEAPGDQPHTEE